jgi:hypothetical protein
LSVPGKDWRGALAGFVAEHSRNAGPTLFRLHFLPGKDEGFETAGKVTRTVAEVRAGPERWLEEGRPILVLR